MFYPLCNECHADIIKQAEKCSLSLFFFLVPERLCTSSLDVWKNSTVMPYEHVVSLVKKKCLIMDSVLNSYGTM